MVIFDRMNSYKTLIDRGVVTSRHFSPSEQPLQEAALFSLCGVGTIITNHWATKPEENLQLLEKMLRGTLTEGLYLGASVKQHWAREVETYVEGEGGVKDSEAKHRNLFRFNTCTFGVPIVRVV